MARMSEGPAGARPGATAACRSGRPAGAAAAGPRAAIAATLVAAAAGLRAAIAAALVAAVAVGCGAAEPAQDPAAGAWVVPSSTPLPHAGAEDPAATGPGDQGTTGPENRGATTAVPAAPGAPSAAPSRAVKTVRFAFPVRAEDVAYHPTHGKYPATDIFADCGTPVVAPVDGTVLEVSRTDEYVEGARDGPRNGGLSVSILGADGVRYYGSHLSRIAPGIDAGVVVEAGRQIGALGRTGNANGVCHLHFGISPPCARTGDWKVRRGVIWPKPYLDSWRRGAARSAAGAAKAWAAKHDCRA